MQRNLTISYWDRLLPVMLILVGGGTAAIALTADLLASGGPQAIGPNQFSLALSGLAVLLAGVVLLSSVHWRHIGEWLLVILAAVGVAFASDLLVINGLPELRAKTLLLTSIGLGVLLTVMVPAASIDRRRLGQWLSLSALDRSQVAKFVYLTLQLGLLVLVVRQFHLENQAFYSNIFLLTFYSFIIHYFLPARYKLPFFVLVSLAALAGILGFANAAWLIAIGLSLVGICHLPIKYSFRVGLLLAAGAALLAIRVRWLPITWLDVIWPVFASMFMFRLIIYMYDLKHGKAKPTLATTLAYFFMLPNVVFPFFPVVDYSTLRRTYFDEEQHQTYQRGLQWILRGVVQLIVYRYVNYYLALGAQEVTNTSELVRYLITNFGLYIRISGQFHVIIGMLHLFGFNLPETHHLYFLASSLTDLWRRINIYWKDFMLKVFYYPIYFKIRHWGVMTSLAVATFIVFVLTWFFHAYQWFWLRGSFLLTVPDVLFWFLLAILVVANTLWDSRPKRKRPLGQPAHALRDISAQALRAAGTFSLMCVLWALWNSDSIRDWVDLMSVVDLSLAAIGTLLGTFAAVTLIFGLIFWIGRPKAQPVGPRAQAPSFYRTAAVTAGSLGLLWLIGSPTVYNQFGGQAQAFVSDLTVNRLSDREAVLLQRGYYEDLIGVSRFNSELWDIYMKRPSDWPSITDTPAARETDDNLIVELVPLTSINFHGAHLTINRWGMRDRDYEQIPAPGTYRVALTGPSFVMGSGVADNEVFEWQLEDRLNQEVGGQRYNHYEILNFAVPGYSVLQDLLVLEQRVTAFQPNALFFVAHQREGEAAVLYLADRIAAGAELPYPELYALVRESGAQPGQTKNEVERRLKPFENEIVRWTYRQMAEVSRSNGILPVWIFVPTLENPVHAEEVANLSGLAQAAGFVTVDMADAYANQNPDSLVVAYWDKHPNAKGHQLLADKLYEALRNQNDETDIFP